MLFKMEGWVESLLESACNLKSRRVETNDEDILTEGG